MSCRICQYNQRQDLLAPCPDPEPSPAATVSPPATADTRNASPKVIKLADLLAPGQPPGHQREMSGKLARSTEKLVGLEHNRNKFLSIFRKS
jgi:hypothetical protein